MPAGDDVFVKAPCGGSFSFTIASRSFLWSAGGLKTAVAKMSAVRGTMRGGLTCPA